MSPVVSCTLTADGRPGEAFARPLLERPGGTLIDPWAKLPTSHDVARRAHVSQSTVSRALRGDPRVSDGRVLGSWPLQSVSGTFAAKEVGACPLDGPIESA